jgi:MFS family permease
MTEFYSWWVYLHILGAFAFAFGHGASGLAAFRIRATRDPAQVRTLLDVSGMSLGVTYVGLLLLLVGGIAAGIAGDHFGRGWIWAALVILVLIMVAMYMLATPFYGQLRVAAGSRAKDPKVDPTPMESQADIDRLAGSNRPTVLLAVGVIGFLVILWLMILKPF